MPNVPLGRTELRFDLRASGEGQDWEARNRLDICLLFRGELGDTNCGEKFSWETRGLGETTDYGLTQHHWVAEPGGILGRSSGDGLRGRTLTVKCGHIARPGPKV